MHADARPIGWRAARPAAVAAIAVATLLILDRLREILRLLPAYRELYDAQPFWVPQGVKSLLQIALVVVAVALLRRVSVAEATRFVGLARRPGPGVFAALAAVVPLWGVFALVMERAAEIPFAETAYLAGLSPLAEEVLYTAFGFGALRRIAGWGFWPAALVPAAIFGYGHAEGSGDPMTWASLFLLTGVGLLAFIWFYERWEYDLWVTVTLHCLMNLSWNVFDVGESAVAGWLPTAMQLTTLVAMVTLTVLRGHRRRASPARNAG